MTDHPASFGRLSAPEALRALYLDFEGGKDQPPVLLGVHRRGRGARPYVQQDVVDETFARLGPSSRTLHDAVQTVVRRAERGNRRIVSWSEHDLNVVRTLLSADPELVARFESRYANARVIARHWRNTVHGGDAPQAGRLADYLALIGWVIPAEAEPGHVGETIRLLRPRLERGLPLAPGHQERWHNLLEHNRHDCAGMRRVCLRATAELETAASR